jgi:hypothetical protein
MANTEWLTVALVSLAMMAQSIPGGEPWSWLMLGLLPWANQKNVLLIAPVAWALGMSASITDLIVLSGPSIVALAYLAATGRAKAFYVWCYAIPKEFGKRRTFKANTVSASRLLIPALALLAPVVASGVANRWALVAGLYVALMLVSKQIVPHHFIALAYFLVLACEPTLATVLGVLLVWGFRDALCLYRPSLVYPVTFGGPGGHYGQMLGDAEKIVKHIPEGSTIWVNGMENNVYLQAKCKATRVEIPELPGVPDKTPEYIVHCATSAKAFDYKGYEPAEISNLGLFTLMRRKRTEVKDFYHMGKPV